METASWDTQARLLRSRGSSAASAGEQQIVVEGSFREIAEYLWKTSEELEHFSILWKDAPVRASQLLDRAVREGLVS